MYFVLAEAGASLALILSAALILLGLGQPSSLVVGSASIAVLICMGLVVLGMGRDP